MRIASAAVLKLLADPTKLRIYEALRDGPASPHELALRFGLKPTALYHHFARLAAAKLIRVAERRRRRGVIERRYAPAATPLVVDRALLRGGRRDLTTVLEAVSAILAVTSEDVREAAIDPTQPLADRRRSEIGTILVRTTPKGARQLMREVRELLATAMKLDGTGETRVRLTLALVPVRR